MSVWSRRITEAGAFWGIIAGLAGNVLTNLVKVVGEVDLPEILNPILVGVAASLTVIILVSRNTQVTDTERRRREELHETPAEERSPARIRRTVKWSAAVVVLGVAMTVGLVLGYALPFGMPIWFPLVMGLSVVVSGAWAWLGVRRAYR
jgi:sodium/pantothenate symporter